MRKPTKEANPINKVKKKHLDNLNKTKGQKLIFKNRRELNKWLEEIGCVS